MKARKRELEELVRSVAEDLGLIFVAVDVLPGLVRVFVDGDGGITVGECENMSRQLEARLDQEDLIQGSYVLEVSSPGLDRVLKTPRERAWAVGKKVKLVTRDGRTLSGTLQAAEDEAVSVNGEVFPVEQIARISLSEVA